MFKEELNGQDWGAGSTGKVLMHKHESLGSDPAARRKAGTHL